MRWNTMSAFRAKFEWHDWFAWYPIKHPDDQYGRVWLEKVERRLVAVGNQGILGNWEWRYRVPRPNTRDGK